MIVAASVSVSGYRMSAALSSAEDSFTMRRDDGRRLCGAWPPAYRGRQRLSVAERAEGQMIPGSGLPPTPSARAVRAGDPRG